MKNNIIYLAGLTLLALLGCQEYSVSYLNATHLNYPTNTLTVVQGLTEEDIYQPPSNAPVFPPVPGGSDTKKESKYKARITHKSPWLSAPFWGASVEGSRPLTIEIASVKTKGEKADAELLKKYTTIYGEGIFSIPFENEIPLGEYLVSLKVSNISGSQIVEDCFTIIVTDVKW